MTSRAKAASLLLDEIVHAAHVEPLGMAKHVERASWLLAWAQKEKCLAAFNPWAAKTLMHESSNYDESGVQNYHDLGEGLHGALHILFDADGVRVEFTDVVDVLVGDSTTFDDFREAMDDVHENSYKITPTYACEDVLSERVTMVEDSGEETPTGENKKETTSE